MSERTYLCALYSDLRESSVKIKMEKSHKLFSIQKFNQTVLYAVFDSAVIAQVQASSVVAVGCRFCKSLLKFHHLRSLLGNQSFLFFRSAIHENIKQVLDIASLSQGFHALS